MFYQQPVPPNTPITPIIVQVVDPPAKEIGVVDILVGSLGITGLLLLASVVLGLAVAALLFWLRRRFTPEPESPSLASAQLNLSSPSSPPSPGTSAAERSRRGNAA